MALTLRFKHKVRRCFWPLFPLLPTVTLWCALAGCGSTCFVGVVNPPNGSIVVKAGDPPPACAMPQATANLRLTAYLAPACTFCSQSSRVTHVYVSLTGVDVHPGVVADEPSGDWQKLAPEWEASPRQFELGAPDGGSEAILLSESARIPAGTYRQVRLRFAPEDGANRGGQAQDGNPCGDMRNCLVTADGRVQKLFPGQKTPALYLTTDELVVSAARSNDLTLELQSRWLWNSSISEGMRVVPTLTGVARLNAER